MSLDFILTSLVYILILVLLHIFIVDASQIQTASWKQSLHRVVKDMNHEDIVDDDDRRPRSILKHNREHERKHVPTTSKRVRMEMDEYPTEITDDYIKYFSEEDKYSNTKIQSSPVVYKEAFDSIRSETTELDAYYDKLLLDQTYSSPDFEKLNKEVNDVLPKRTSNIVSPPTTESLDASATVYGNVMAFDEYEVSSFGSSYSPPLE